MRPLGGQGMFFSLAHYRWYNDYNTSNNNDYIFINYYSYHY